MSARSCALRIRLSLINVSEKESRICFGVIGDTPPSLCLRMFETALLGKQHDDITKLLYRQVFFSKQEGSARNQSSHHGLENLDSIGAAQFGLGGTLRMRHHTHHVSTGTADAGDVLQRAVGICRRSDFSRSRT